MGLCAPAAMAAAYLDAHSDWLAPCVQPMRAEPLGAQGYLLTIGRFDAFGYRVEPQMAVVFESPQVGLYQFYNVPLTDQPPEPLYKIHYQAAMQLQETNAAAVAWGASNRVIAPIVTRVDWYLNLTVTWQLPRLMAHVPRDWTQNLGETGLAQILQQMTPRLTQAVQQDFHQRHALLMPPRTSRRMVRVNLPTTQFADVCVDGG